MRSMLLNAGRMTLIAAAFLATGMSGRAAAEAGVNPSRFEPSPCPGSAEGVPEDVVQALVGARCGYLVVPENRSRQTGRTIRLIVAIVPAQAPVQRDADAAREAVVYMPHGPGGIALLDIKALVAAGLNRDRDLVLMSQRGTYLAQPALTCAAMDEFARLLPGLRFYAEATLRAHLAATIACRDDLVARGVELSAYNTTASEADFADLLSTLRELGYRQWHLFAASYGTFLAQTFMRDYPEGIRSVILDSTVPLDVTLAGFWLTAREGFDGLFRACAEQEACRRVHPNLEETFTRLVNALEDRPVSATVTDSRTGEAIRVVIDGGALIDWLRSKSYQAPEAFRPLPDLIQRLAARQPSAIETVARERVADAPSPPGPGVPTVGYGLALGVVCREWYPFATDEDLRRTARRAFPHFPASIQDQAVGSWAYANEDCRQVWDIPAAPPAMRQGLQSTIPTLLISGGFDAVTSRVWTEAAAANLRNATIVAFPGFGHFVTPQSRCAQQVVASFLARPGMPDTACVTDLVPPAFAASDPG